MKTTLYDFSLQTCMNSVHVCVYFSSLCTCSSLKMGNILFVLMVHLNLDYPYLSFFGFLDYQDFFSSPNFVMNIYES